MPLASSRTEVEVHDEREKDEEGEAVDGGFMIGKKKMEFTSDNL